MDRQTDRWWMVSLCVCGLGGGGWAGVDTVVMSKQWKDGKDAP